MGNFARKIIDAVQHSLLDKLFERLFPLLWLALAWNHLRDEAFDAVFAVAVAVLLAGVLLIWGLGALANRRPRPRSTAPLYDRLHKEPANGFDAWTEPPEGGLRPPRIMRAIVKTLGSHARSDWIMVVELAAFLAAIALVGALAYASPAFWAEVHPRLADVAAREILMLVAAGAVVAMLIRSWAIAQCSLLEPAAPKAPALAAYLMISLLAAFLLSIVAVGLGRPFWMGAAAGAALSVLAFAPPWRNRVADVVFGRRDETAPVSRTPAS